jgi:DNA-binding transcriptional ArsR family regulator
MPDIPDIAAAAALIGDPARANILSALKDDHALSATELANVAGVAPNTASGHLARLVKAGMIEVEAKGRNRYYRLSCHEVADALETIEALTSKLLPDMEPQIIGNHEMRFARSCYDHLAGTVGVRLTQQLRELKYIVSVSNGFFLTNKGERAFSSLGIDVQSLKTSRRCLTRRCPDWSEHSIHLGGALGAALFKRFLDLGWIQKRRGSRAVSITQRGKKALKDYFSLSLV